MEETWFPRMCQQRMLEWKQIWFSRLYDSDLRKIDAQIRCNKSSLGIFCVSNERAKASVQKKRRKNTDRKAMYKLSYGLFVLTAREDGKDNGCIINTAIQAASEPNQLSICVNKAKMP